ncbi:MAG: hypothetical protein MZU95_16440 [Desulfomicrobium escambiense]|nr:hypothetical protein [Desulfomicrobium escambiense]
MPHTGERRPAFRRLHERIPSIPEHATGLPAGHPSTGAHRAGSGPGELASPGRFHLPRCPDGRGRVHWRCATARHAVSMSKRPVHIVPMWNRALGREVEAVWPGIAEVQTTAARTGQWAGMDPARFGPELTQTFQGRVKVQKGGRSTRSA